MGRLPCHIGSGQAHGDSDIGDPEGRSIIDSVSGHGDDFVQILEGLHDLDLLRGVEARIDSDVPDLFFILLLPKPFKFLSGQTLFGRIQNAKL